jgi:signal transduction histidine kinase
MAAMAWLARRRTFVLIVFIGLLLPVLAVLQYRWLGELSGLEQLRAHTNVRNAAARFSAEFDAQLATIYSAFYEASSGDAAQSLDKLQRVVRSIPTPDLIEQVYIITRAPDGGFTAQGIDTLGNAMGAVPPPAWLDKVTAYDLSNPRDDTLPDGLSHTLVGEIPAIVVRRPVAEPERWTVIEFDLKTIGTKLLPEMLAGCFEGGIPTAYDVLVVRDDRTDGVIYQSRPELSAADFPTTQSPMPVFAIHGRDLDLASAQTLLPDAAAHRWRLLVQPQAGTLEAAIGAARIRNLVIGIGILALLAVSVGMLVASTHATQRATREQLELVARISHELRTPLATITCAGENLADRLVGDPADTQQYGELIKREGRRLTRTLEDILLCCRMQARTGRVLHRQPVDVEQLIHLAVAEHGPIAASGRIETRIDPGLPPVLADADALKMAFKNLLANAIKYGDGRPVRISARAQRGPLGAELVVAFEDQGHGIPSDEVEHVFDPFFRGRTARALEVEGSGIGLSIVREVVRSHDGHIRVFGNEPRGTRFVVHLPTVKAGHAFPADPAA